MRNSLQEHGTLISGYTAEENVSLSLSSNHELPIGPQEVGRTSRCPPKDL